MSVGAEVLQDGTVRFLLWAPLVDSVDLHLIGDGTTITMENVGGGYFQAVTDRARGGSRYWYRIGDDELPDPASRSQPDGVHGPSEVVDFSAVSWNDADFEPPDSSALVIYELHTGTFTRDGTFAAASTRLESLAALGINAVEVMPIAEFAGNRNWGYDGVALFAAESSYGGPLEFARFVDAAHAAGLAVILDVVCNHFGPEGNYSGRFGTYTTDKYRTPWGDAINFDGRGSDDVRRFYLDCLEHWMSGCHVDGFRLDAIHEIHDESAVPFLSQVSELVHSYSRDSGKPRILIAESDLNDRRVIEPSSGAGLGMDAAWADDFHHAVHAHLTGERNGYFADFGGLEHVARALEHGWSYAWDYSVSRGRRHGNDPSGLPAKAFVFCTQNHDQVGNRMLGERLCMLAGHEADRAARALLLLSPYVPLLFMGQEYGEERPFLYFVDHTDAELLEATRAGRAREFAAFHRDGSPPDPGSPETRDRSTLEWPHPNDEEAAAEARLTGRLIALRRRYDCFRPAAEGSSEVTRRVWCSEPFLFVRFSGSSSVGLVIANLSREATEIVPASVLGAGEAPAPSEIVCSLEDSGLTGTSLEPNESLRLEPYDLIAAVGSRRRRTSHR